MPGKRLKANIQWNDNMTITIQVIKQKIQNLHSLHLPDLNLPFVLETNASDEVWSRLKCSITEAY